MQYVYEGPGPVENDGQIIRPGDVREFPEPPPWGPWRATGTAETLSPPPPPDDPPTPPATAKTNDGEGA